MKAFVYSQYGGPEVLRLEEVSKPAPGDDEVLIRIRAASLNPLDWRLMRGKPLVARMAVGGLRRPAPNSRLGVDVAGVVEATGRNVARFKPGDEIYGACDGTCAEYASTHESRVSFKPRNMTFEQAAAVNVAGRTALQALRDRIEPGQRLLINGAAGGVGTFAVQIARTFGAEVTGVCSTRNVELVRSLGADHVIDYTRDDFTKGRYDVILDCIGNRSLSACRRALTPEGTYIWVGGPLRIPLAIALLSKLTKQKLVVALTKRIPENLDTLRELMEAGKVTPVIDRVYPLSETAKAMAYLEGGHARGKVVLAVS